MQQAAAFDQKRNLLLRTLVVHIPAEKRGMILDLGDRLQQMRPDGRVGAMALHHPFRQLQMVDHVVEDHDSPLLRPVHRRAVRPGIRQRAVERTFRNTTEEEIVKSPAEHVHSEREKRLPVHKGAVVTVKGYTPRRNG